jgi:hypothetical protein
MRKSTDHDELGLILGAWVPTIKTPVCDKPFAFAVVSADSSSPEDVSVISATILSTERFGKSRQQMFAIINHDPNHKWYYYPYQKPNEMLLAARLGLGGGVSEKPSEDSVGLAPLHVFILCDLVS